jgi:hypothetical protein
LDVPIISLREQQVEQHGILIIEIQCLEPLGSTRVVGLAEFWEASQNRSRSMSRPKARDKTGGRQLVRLEGFQHLVLQACLDLTICPDLGIGNLPDSLRKISRFN